MTLIERRAGEEDKVYQDSDWLPRARWNKLIGVSVISGISHGGARVKKGPPRHKYQQEQVLIPVEDFPKIVSAMGQLRMGGYGDFHYHPWARVDTTRDFEITVPSGATLVYKYEKK